MNETLHRQDDISLYSNAFGYLRSPLCFDPEKSDADTIITGIPFDMATSGRPGCRYGAQAIRQASVMFAWEHKRFPWDFALNERMRLADCGDLVFPSGDPGAMVKALYDHAITLLNAGKRMLSLGGDHFITLPLLRAHAKKYGTLALVHFDAHSDTYKEGSAYDHGTMFARAPAEKIINPASSIQIGIRTEYHEEDGFEVIDGPSANSLPSDEIAEKIKERTGKLPVYLSFDIDCLDPAFAPGTGTPVPGGLCSEKALGIIRKLSDLNIVGADIVEVSPAYDHSDITAIAAAAIALDILYAMAS